MKEKKHIFVHLFFTLLCIMCLLPIILLISMSFTSDAEMVTTGISIIPKFPSARAYKMLFDFPDRIISGYKVTIAITVIGTILNVLISALIAYPLSQNEYRWKNKTSFYVYFTMLFGGGLIPFYILCTQVLNLKNTLLVLILPQLAGPWNIFLLRTFFQQTPKSLLESARIDGASEYEIFFKIIIPLNLPGLATIALISSLGYWNEWYNAMLFIDKSNLKPLQTILQELQSYVDFLKQNRRMGLFTEEVPSDAVIAATCIVTTGPMLLVFSFFQKYFIAGITAGAVKE